MINRDDSETGADSNDYTGDISVSDLNIFVFEIIHFYSRKEFHKSATSVCYPV